ncbi:MAG: hypothetical protein ACYC7A_12675 [Thermoanaerobaculia bacterium]
MSAVETLLENLIDYAGLFPPAGLSMEQAVANYAHYRASSDSWALGRFVVPIARFAELEPAIAPHLRAAAWNVSAIAGNDLEADRKVVDAFNERHRGRAIVDAVEVKAGAISDIDRATSAFNGLAVYFEIASASDPSELINAAVKAGGRAKIRTGGVAPEAIPPASDVVRFLRRCVDHGIAFKATAGLHHPVRCDRALTYEAGAPTATMHGFLNVFLTTAAMVGGMSDARAETLLLEADPAQFAADDHAIWWRDVHIGVDQIAQMRSLAVSFGSCSFEEPVGELREMGWV